MVIVLRKSYQVSPILKSFGNEKKLTLGDVVAQGPSKSRLIKSLMAIFFPEQCSCTEVRPVKQGLSLNEQTSTGLWSCHTEQAVKGAFTVAQAGRDGRRLAAVAHRATRRAITTSGGGALTALT